MNETDFRWITDWGFDFVRIPLDYRLWIRDSDPFTIEESGLIDVDHAVRLGEKYQLHICLNVHRAPGYCISDIANAAQVEPFSLWKDHEALECFQFHWETLARRFRGIASEKLSFNLVNEPPLVRPETMTRQDHERVVRAAVQTIRAVDPDRLIIADGVMCGSECSPELADLGIAQSCRGYAPLTVSHYRAKWIRGIQEWADPIWPGSILFDEIWDRTRLENYFKPWADLARSGVGVFCGEAGFFNQTNHAIGLAWLNDVLEILTDHQIGYALWNFRGSFGVLDSGRSDVAYEDWHGHHLDRKLLALLQSF